MSLANSWDQEVRLMAKLSARKTTRAKLIAIIWTENIETKVCAYFPGNSDFKSASK